MGSASAQLGVACDARAFGIVIASKQIVRTDRRDRFEEIGDASEVCVAAALVVKCA
jgi:hypothetical protein